MYDIIPRPALNLSEDWMILVFLFPLLSLAYTRRLYPARLIRLWRSTWNVRALHEAIREEPNTPRANLLLNISFYLILALAVYLVLKQMQAIPFDYPGIVNYLIILAILRGIYLAKTIIIRLIQIISDGDYGMAEYEYNLFLMNRMSGLLLLLPTLFMAYAPIPELKPAIYTAAIVLIGMVSYRILRGLVNALSEGVPPFYILFYICTLEILPFAVGWKALLL